MFSRDEIAGPNVKLTGAPFLARPVERFVGLIRVSSYLYGFARPQPKLFSISENFFGKFEIFPNLDPPLFGCVREGRHTNLLVFLASIVVNHEIQAVSHDHRKLHQAMGDSHTAEKATYFHWADRFQKL